MNDFSGRTKPNEVTPPEGLKRTITVELDAAQYQLDMDHMQETKGTDPYAAFNVLMRRKPKVSFLNLTSEQTLFELWACWIFLAKFQKKAMLQQAMLKVCTLSWSHVEQNHVCTASHWPQA